MKRERGRKREREKERERERKKERKKDRFEKRKLFSFPEERNSSSLPFFPNSTTAS